MGDAVLKQFFNIVRQPARFRLEVTCRVHSTAIVVNGVMQMRTGGPTSGTHVANHLALGNILAGADNVVSHMCVQRGVAITMVNGNIVAISTAVCSGGNGSAAGSVNGSTLGVGQVNAIVEAVLAGDGVDSPAIGRGQADVGAGGDPALAGRGR